MSPSFRSAVTSVDQAIRRRAGAQVREAFERGGWPAVASFGFDLLNVRPEYLHDRDPSFFEDRARLQRDPGFLIANHPGSADAFILFETLEREDVLILVADAYADAYRETLGDRVIPASRDLGVLRAALRRAEDHIADGGLLMVFPTGGLERGGKPFRFGRFFEVLLRRAAPTDMVYAFAIDPAYPEATGRGSLPGKVQTASEVLAADLVGASRIPRLAPPRAIAVDECCADVEAWRRSAAVAPLEDVYRRQFPGFF